MEYCVNSKCFTLLRLMRVHQPIGFFLLLWPTLWGLWLANRGVPDFVILIKFIIGVFCMRSVGCIINDYIDRDIDSLVQRTKDRPLSTGAVNMQEACIVLLVLVLILVVLVCTFNIVTMLLSLIAFVFSVIYPCLKRYTYFPQLVLGMLFSWSILMAYTVIDCVISSAAVLLFIGNTLWVISYDTQYAMVDRQDDQYIGLKSFSLLFGDMDRYVVGILQLMTVFILGVIGWIEQLTMVFYGFAVFGIVILFMWQQILINCRKQSECFKAFLSNNYVGMLVFIGIALSFY